MREVPRGADQTRSSLAELLCAMSFTTDIGMGQDIEHGLKSAYIGLKLTDLLGLSNEDREAVFYGALLKDAGCTACAAMFATFFGGDDVTPRRECLVMRADSVKDAFNWFWRYGAKDVALPGRIAGLLAFLAECKSAMKEGVTAHCEVGEMFSRRLALPETVQRAVRFSWERWDGKGLAYGLKGDDTPIAARIVHIAQVLQVAHCFGGRATARAIAEERRGTDFDPELVDAFLELSKDAGFWEILEQEPAQQDILEMRPRSTFDKITQSDVDQVCEVLADFADVKSRNTWNHSLVAADAATEIARYMGFKSADLVRVRRSALVHDLGQAAVPVGILDKGEDLTPTEWERFRLHPYYTERVLERIGPLKDLAFEAGAHHETIDGRGYHRQLMGEQIPLVSRILAVADTYAALWKRQPEQADSEAALKEMRAMAGRQLDSSCYEALVSSLRGTAVAKRPVWQHHPGNLTEREVEVLQLVCAGLSNREVAKRLFISDKTVEHHLEHIYNKLGVSCRTSAVVFAVQQGLVS